MRKPLLMTQDGRGQWYNQLDLRLCQILKFTGWECAIKSSCAHSGKGPIPLAAQPTIPAHHPLPPGGPS
jgi:hypothetical protein